MFKILSCVLLLGAVANAQMRYITSNYEQSTDQTKIAVTFAVSPMLMDSDTDSWLLGTSFKGDKVPDAPDWELSVVTTAKNWRLRGADLNVRGLIDGESVDLGIMTRVNGRLRPSSTFEAASIKLSSKVVERIANAKKFEVEVADLNRSFEENDLKKIKFFLEKFRTAHTREDLKR